MIDIATETVFTPGEATRHLPPRRAGKRVNVATIFRWMQTGCKGIKLESIMVGATCCTSLQALQRFFDALTEAAEREEAAEPVTSTTPPPLTKNRKRQIEAAERRLATAAR